MLEDSKQGRILKPGFNPCFVVVKLVKEYFFSKIIFTNFYTMSWTYEASFPMLDKPEC